MAETRRRLFVRHPLDVRLPIGIVVILASVAAAVGLVAALDRTATAWAAPHDLVVGDVVRLADLHPRPVRLDLVEGSYLVGSLDPDAEIVVLRSVGVGELIPLSAVGDVTTIETAVVVVPIDGPLASGLVPGSTADLWAARPEQGGGATGSGPPVVLVPAAVVGRVVEDAGIVAGTAIAVEVVVPRDRVATVLDALAAGAAIALVPALPRPATVDAGVAADDPAVPEPTPHPTQDGG